VPSQAFVICDHRGNQVCRRLRKSCSRFCLQCEPRVGVRRELWSTGHSRGASLLDSQDPLPDQLTGRLDAAPSIDASREVDFDSTEGEAEAGSYFPLSEAFRDELSDVVLAGRQVERVEAAGQIVGAGQRVGALTSCSIAFSRAVSARVFASIVVTSRSLSLRRS
jgi:hypothetical protein